jgi:hypothetical protein
MNSTYKRRRRPSTQAPTSLSGVGIDIEPPQNDYQGRSADETIKEPIGSAAVESKSTSAGFG